MRKFLSSRVICLLTCLGAPLHAQSDAFQLVLVDSSRFLGDPAREPMIAHHPSGALFVAGYGGAHRGYRGSEPLVPRLWRSDDGGKSWARVDVGREQVAAIGNSDPELDVSPNGTLYFASLKYDPERQHGVSLAMGVSRDTGRRWHWQFLSERPFTDRPWVESARNGTAYAVWADTAGVLLSASANNGLTWSAPTRVHDDGGSSHLAVGPTGELAIRIGPSVAMAPSPDKGPDLVAVSTDGGSTWSKHPAPAQLPWHDDTGVPRWVEPLAFDERGALYALWSEGGRMRLGRSEDRGATWREWTIAEDEGRFFFPYLSSKNGMLAATWMSHKDATGLLRGHVALIDVRQGEPQVTRAAPFYVESAPDPGGEYLAAAFLTDGSIAVVSPVQNYDRQQFGFDWRQYRAR